MHEINQNQNAINQLQNLINETNEQNDLIQENLDGRI